jgi:hypothetical protein
MKRGNSIVAGGCPGRRSLLSERIHRLLTHPQILRESHKFEGDKLVWCVRGAGQDRPSAFESEVGSGTFLQVFRRQKAGE